MADIIKFKDKSKKKPKIIDFKYLSSMTTDPVMRSEEEIENLNKDTLEKTIRELDRTLDELIRTSNTSNVYLGKLHGTVARRIHRYGLDKEIYKAYYKRGLYFDFKFVYQDEWNSYGRVLVFWDQDYTKFLNRLGRRINLFLNVFSIVR